MPGRDAKKKKGNKYCDCLAKVAAKQSPGCLPPRKARPPGCYNPYAVCAKLKPRGRKTGCFDYYDLEAMSPQLIKSFAALHGKTVAQIKNGAPAAKKRRRRKAL